MLVKYDDIQALGGGAMGLIRREKGHRVKVIRSTLPFLRLPLLSKGSHIPDKKSVTSMSDLKSGQTDKQNRRTDKRTIICSRKQEDMQGALRMAAYIPIIKNKAHFMQTSQIVG